MKHLLPLLLLSCTAPVAPVASKNDTVFIFQTVHDTVLVPEAMVLKDTGLFCVMWTEERYIEYYPVRDSLMVSGNKDTILHRLVRKLYERY